MPYSRDTPHPRSPVQPPSSNLPYFLAAVFAAVGLWSVQQDWLQDWHPEPDHSQHLPASRPAKGDLRSLFSPDDYPADAQMKGEQGTAQARLSIDISGRVKALHNHPQLGIILA